MVSSCLLSLVFVVAETPFHQAVSAHLDAGGSPNAAYRRTSLRWIHAAAAKGELEAIRLLVRRGANLELRASRAQLTPLHVAISKRKQATAIEIVRLGGNPLARAKSMNALHAAAAFGLDGLVVELLNRKLDIEAPGPNGATPLLMACAMGQEIVVDRLLARGAKTTARIRGNYTPLHSAAESGSSRLVTSLVKRGLQLEAKSSDRLAFTPIFSAAFTDQISTFNALRSLGARTDTRAGHGRALLHIAAGKGANRIIKALVSMKVDLNLTDESGLSPIHMSVIHGHVDSVKLLLNAGADTNIRARDGRTPLDYAILQKNRQIEQLLRKAGAKATG